LIPTFDFETYSEAGYKFDPTSGSFRPLQAGKPGLKGINAPVYAEHMSTRVISLAFDLLDGCGIRLWTPVRSAPIELFNLIWSGGELEAHNSGFEFNIWEYVCRQRMGWPELPLAQLMCSMAKARSQCLPGGLGKVATIVGGEQKNPRGAHLIRLLSVPKKPTKNDPMTYRSFEKYPELYYEMYDYNDRDVVSEKSVSSMLPDLGTTELAVWRLDQRINARGVQIDTEGLDACITLFKQVELKYTAELQQITGGAVQTIGEMAKLKAGDMWAQSMGVNLPSFDKPSVIDALERTDLPAPIRRALEIRQGIGGSAVKKIFALHRYLNADGRIRDLFVYCGAERTGRWAGRGPQPQNLRNGGPDSIQCDTCGSHSVMVDNMPACRVCGTLTRLERVEWGNLPAKAALEDILAYGVDRLEHVWGSAISLIGSVMRSLFVAAPLHDLICSDYSAIEAVVLAALAGEEWRLEVFRTHGKIYEASAAHAFNVPLQEILDHRERTGKHHPLRKKGKVRELACFTHDTQVLTDVGYVGIVDVKSTHLLWDGVEWVKNDGVTYRGKRKILKLDGVRVTPEHLININGSWMEARELVSNKSMLSRALVTGSESIPLLNTRNEGKEGVPCVRVRAVREDLLIYLTYIWVRLQGVAVAAGIKRPIRESNYTRNTHTYYQTPGTDGVLSIDYVRLLPGVIASIARVTRITAVGVLGWIKGGSGKTAQENSSSTLSPSKDGTPRHLKWIGSIRMAITNRITSGLLLKPKTVLIKEAYKKCKNELMNLKGVYDIVNAGPRNQFTIKTDSGHLLVHNCGYSGWINACRQFGYTGTDDEIKADVLSWRAESPNIVEMWGGQWRKEPGVWRFTPELYGVEGQFIQACLYPDTERLFRDLTFAYDSAADSLCIRLPSGRDLVYHSPRLNKGIDPRRLDVWKISYMGIDSYTHRWERIQTYGGKLTENITQAVARDILAAAMLRLDAAGYPIVLHVHDEVICEVPHGFGSIEELEAIMMQREPWFIDWPIKAAGGWRGHRYRK